MAGDLGWKSVCRIDGPYLEIKAAAMLAALSLCARHSPVFANEIPGRLASSSGYPACRPDWMNSHKRMADMEGGTV